MAYEEVTSPILTDATGQDIVDKLDEIAQNLQPPTNIDASDVTYDNTQSGMTATNVQAAVTELKSNLTDLEDYSETEQVVGKWIDGSTLYRKVIKVTGSNAGNVTISVPTDKLPTSYNVRKIDFIWSYKVNGTGSEYVRNEYISYYYDSGHKFVFSLGAASITYTITATVYYTK